MPELYRAPSSSAMSVQLLRKESDFEAFERVMVEAHLRQQIRSLSYPHQKRPVDHGRDAEPCSWVPPRIAIS